MISVNEVTIAGTMYKIKKIETKTGKSMAAFTVRVYKKIKEKESVEFFDVVCFSATADIVLQYGAEKRECLVDGYLQSSKDDNGHTRWSIVANSVQLLGEKVA